MDQLCGMVVGADVDTSRRIVAVLHRNGLRTATASDGSDGLVALRRHGAELLFVELGLPGLTEFLGGALLLRPYLGVIGLAARASLDSVVQAMRMGACDYLAWPPGTADIAAALDRALARRLRLQSQSAAPAVGGGGGGDLTMALDCHILAPQVPARKVLAFIAKLAPGPSAVQVRTEPSTASVELPTRELKEMISVLLTGDLRHGERQIVEEVIRRLGGNKAAAARALGLHRRTLYRLLSKD
jgi:DNA-binding NtrC family response regulator